MRKRVYKVMRALLCICLMVAICVLPCASTVAAETAYQEAIRQLALEQGLDADEVLAAMDTETTEIEPGYVYRIRNMGDLTKYLTANLQATSSADAVKVAALDTSNNAQLWYVKDHGSYYTLENLGMRDDASNGLYQCIARGTSAGTVMFDTNQTVGLWEQWNIQADEDGFIEIRNVGYSSTKYLYNMNDSGGKVNLSATRDLYSKWSFERVEMPYYWSNGYQRHTIGNTFILKIVVPSNAINAIMEFERYKAAEKWNGASSNVRVLVEKESELSNIQADAVFRIMWQTNNWETNAIARMEAMRDDGNLLGKDPNLESLNDMWLAQGGVIKIFESVKGNRILESMKDKVEEKERIIIHEVGHALKLQHPHDYNASYRAYSLMMQGTYDAYRTYGITGHDRATLREKWGG